MGFLCRSLGSDPAAVAVEFARTAVRFARRSPAPGGRTLTAPRLAQRWVARTARATVYPSYCRSFQPRPEQGGSHPSASGVAQCGVHTPWTGVAALPTPGPGRRPSWEHPSAASDVTSHGRHVLWLSPRDPWSSAGVKVRCSRLQSRHRSRGTALLTWLLDTHSGSWFSPRHSCRPDVKVTAPEPSDRQNYTHWEHSSRTRRPWIQSERCGGCRTTCSCSSVSRKSGAPWERSSQNAVDKTCDPWVRKSCFFPGHSSPVQVQIPRQHWCPPNSPTQHWSPPSRTKQHWCPLCLWSPPCRLA